MPEKRNIYYLQTIVLITGGFWSPYTSKDPLYKRILYKIWGYYVFVASAFWEICLMLLFVYDSKTTDMTELSMGMAFLVQLMLGNIKVPIACFKRKDIEWLAEQTEVEPFYREHDEEFKKNLRKTVATTTNLSRLFWFLVFFTLNIPAVTAFLTTLNNSYTMNNNCNKQLNIYRERFNKFNQTMPPFARDSNIYEQIDLIEEFIENKHIFEMDKEIVCAVPFKKLPFGAHTPYDHQKFFWISFFLQWTSFWFYSQQNMPFDLIIMSTMIHIRFQFQYLIKDLLNLREDSKKSASKRLGKREEEIDEETLAGEMVNRLKSIILHHEHIYKYHFLSVDVYTWILFAQYFGTVIMMVGMMYELAFTSVKSLAFLQMCFFMTGISFQIYINCHYGNELIDSSEQVATAAYDCGWEKSGTYSAQLKPYLLMIMARSLRATSFTAGKFIYISLDTFVTIAKTSYSYYTVMSNMQ